MPGTNTIDAPFELAPDPSVTGPEQCRIAAGLYERGSDVLASGNYEYSIPLLLNCCSLDPVKPEYRQALREARAREQVFHPVWAWLCRARALLLKLELYWAQHAGRHLRVLDCGERILEQVPADVTAPLAMAEAAEALGCSHLALWLLEQAHEQHKTSVPINRALALFFEKRDHLPRALKFWERVLKAQPEHAEAKYKIKSLSASEAIVRGNYRAILSQH